MAAPTDINYEVQNPETTNTHVSEEPLIPTGQLLLQTLCVSDNPCVVATIDAAAGVCEFQTTDLQGEVFCDDHNPCTRDDMCYEDYCLGEVIEGCDLDDTYYY